MVVLRKSIITKHKGLLQEKLKTHFQKTRFYCSWSQLHFIFAFNLKFQLEIRRLNNSKNASTVLIDYDYLK
jgi:hypothetical protein